MKNILNTFRPKKRTIIEFWVRDWIVITFYTEIRIGIFTYRKKEYNKAITTNYEPAGLLILFSSNMFGLHETIPLKPSHNRMIKWM